MAYVDTHTRARPRFANHCQPPANLFRPALLHTHAAAAIQRATEIADLCQASGY